LLLLVVAVEVVVHPMMLVLVVVRGDIEQVRLYQLLLEQHIQLLLVLVDQKQRVRLV
jgi:hypothetical protein